MFSNNQINSVYSRYHVSNVAKSEDFVHIIRPDKSAEVYKQFEELINDKIKIAMKWLYSHGIKHELNNKIEGHLYRLYIPEKDLLFDFEYYPVINMNYNYIRINYDSDIISVLERIFPTNAINTAECEFYLLNQKASNKFLKENTHSPIYYKGVLRIGLVKDDNICQCMIVQDNRVIANVIRRNCSIPYGTYMLFRYLTESLCFPEILIKDNLDNSYTTDFYQLANLSRVKSSSKKKIWWSPQGAKWHPEDTSSYIPFYFTEQITYSYKNK